MNSKVVKPAVWTILVVLFFLLIYHFNTGEQSVRNLSELLATSSMKKQRY